MKNEANTPQGIMATVYLRSESGRSLFKERNRPPIHSKPYLPSAETRTNAIAKLQELGFHIEGQGVTLSISGPVALFESVCNAVISFKEQDFPDPRGHNHQRIVLPRSLPEVLHIPGCEDLIEAIVISSIGVPLRD